jgi:WD40 repeat protein
MGTCTPPWEDCDKSPLTGCEANLSSDASHCGRCDSECDGACGRRGCHEAESFLSQVKSFSSIAMSADYVYLLTGNSIDGPVRLWQVNKAERSERLLADNLPWFEQVTVANGRVYLYGRGENLWSGSEQGDFSDEGFEVRSIATSAGVLYADRDGTLVARKENETSWTPQPWMVSSTDNVTDNVKLWPIDVSNQLCVLRETGDSLAKYELLRVDSPDSPDGGLVPLASGSGELVRLRSQNGSVYFLVYEESGLLQLLRRDVRGNTRIQVLSTGNRIGDFAVDSTSLYVTRWPMHGYELEVMSAFGNGTTLKLGVLSAMSSLEADGNHLWFFGRDGLQRVELPLGDL